MSSLALASQASGPSLSRLFEMHSPAFQNVGRRSQRRRRGLVLSEGWARESGQLFFKKNPEIYINTTQYNIVIIITNTVV